MDTTQDNDGNGNGKGKEIERPRTPERQVEEKTRGKPRPDYLKRRFYEGKWYCDCENGTVPAQCLTSTSVYKKNYRKKCTFKFSILFGHYLSNDIKRLEMQQFRRQAM